MSDYREVRRRIFIGLLVAALILWTAFIFLQSSKSGEESSSDSDSVVGMIEKVVRIFIPGAEVSSHLVRKLAHFSEYCILALIAAALVGMLRKGWLYAAAWGYAVVVAFCDEFIVQRLSEGRGPQFTDVLIDSSGALVGVGCMAVVIWMTTRRKKQNSDL